MTTIKWTKKKFRIDDRHYWTKFSSIKRTDDGTGSITSHYGDYGNATSSSGREIDVYYHIVVDAHRCEHCGLVIEDKDDPRMNDDCPVLVVDSIHDS